MNENTYSFMLGNIEFTETFAKESGVNATIVHDLLFLAADLTQEEAMRMEQAWEYSDCQLDYTTDYMAKIDDKIPCELLFLKQRDYDIFIAQCKNNHYADVRMATEEDLRKYNLN